MWTFYCVLLFALRFTIQLAYSSSDLVPIFECCPPGQTVSSRNVCKSFNGQWAPTVISMKDSKIIAKVPNNFNFVQKRPECSNITFIRGPIILNADDGTVIMSISGHYFIRNSTTCCVSKSGVLCCLSQSELKSILTIEKQARKCCLANYIYSELKSACIPSASKLPIEDTFVITSGFPTCETNEYAVIGKVDVDMKFDNEGILRTMNGIQVQEFCVDHVVERFDVRPSVFVCADELLSRIGESEQTDYRHQIYPWALLLSNIFLVVTLISGCFLPVAYHALQWKCQTYYMVCLLIGDVLLMITQWNGAAMRDSKFCVGIGTAMHFFFLAAFCWLSTMCCNIWWLFQAMRPAILSRGQEINRLILYGWFAWGVPFIIVSLGSLADHWFYYIFSEVPRPNFGKSSCWFENRTEQFYYFFAPVGFLLAMNFFFFGATTRELVYGLWRTETQMPSSDKYRTSLGTVCLKLVIVMGVPWIMDVLSWIFKGPEYIWYLTDLINASQGIFIFIAVGYPILLWNAIKRLLCWTTESCKSKETDVATYSSFSDERSSMRPEDTSC